MENFMEQVDVKDLVYESNRRYGKDAGFEQLVASIREYGILEPILVRREGEGKYRVIAGRRRAQAAGEAGLKAVDCIVREDDADDGELALMENINRLEMHPLDEADIFRRMKDTGATVEYIARYFARSVQAISQRIRLSGLAAGPREMFREGRLDIRGAVLLSGLPDDNQEGFYKKYEGKNAGVWQAQEYIVKTQGRRLYSFMMDDECETCGERTRNGDAGLFEGDERFDDVCLSPECYRDVWSRNITLALRERFAGQPDDRKITKIFFDSSVPPCLYGGMVEIDDNQYEVLTEKRYVLDREETNRKKNVYWRISRRKGALQVERCGYETRETQKEREDKRAVLSLLEGYGKELLGVLGAERQEKPEEIAKHLKSRGIDNFDFKNLIWRRIRRTVAERNSVNKGNRNYAAMYLWHCLKDKEAELEKYTGFKSFTDIRLEAAGQGLFRFLLEAFPYYELVPPLLEDLGDKKQEYRKKLFWEYAGMDEENYREMCLEAGRMIVAHLLEGGTVEALEEWDVT
jgi:ParB/RepB/Spo0J family partition protein